MESDARKNNVNKRIWINIGLFAAIIILSIYISWSDKQTVSEVKHLTNIDASTIMKIDVERKDLKNFSFEKKGDDWYMQSPMQFRANVSRINAMLRMLQVESHGSLNPDEIDLSRFELDDPKIIMKLDNHEFQFGNTDAIDQRRYVLFENKIHLVNDFLYQQLMTNAAFFADSKLLKEGTEITSIEFPDNKIEKTDSGWQMQTPLDIKPDDLQSIAFSWQDALAISVSLYEAPETESLIKVKTKNNETVIFVIVKTTPHLVLGRKDLGIEYHMGSDDARRLLLHENIKPENTDTPALELNKLG